MTLSMSRFSIAAITGLMLLSLTPSSAQAFCLWGYGNTCSAPSPTRSGSGAGKAVFQDLDLVEYPADGEDVAPDAEAATATGFAPTAGAALGAIEAVGPPEQGDPDANRYDFGGVRGEWRPDNAAA